jgi:DnaA family protein
MSGSYSPAGQQLALGVNLRDDATLDNFLPTAQQASLLSSLQLQSQEQGEQLIYLHGAADTGKSHLLQGCCHELGATALYLPLSEFSHFDPPEVLAGLEQMSLLCLDDLHAVVGGTEWELALFNLFNRARDRGCRLLLSADSAPRQLAVELADLRSRLSWGVVFRLSQVDDEHRAEVLRFRASRRGLLMSADVASYIISRAPRALGDLLGLLDVLDQASLVEQRALSIPFVKETLSW